MRIYNSGHATIFILGTKTVCIDPFKLDNTQIKADIVLVTHPHFDHFDPEKISQVSKPDTIVVCHNCDYESESIEVGELKEIGKITIEAVPAYNPEKKFHPKDFGAGYIICIDGKRIYHAGDTDVIPEMENFENIDLACLPIGGHYTMDENEALEAALLIKPKAAMPMHYGGIVKGDPQAFKEIAEKKGIKVFIKEAVI